MLVDVRQVATGRSGLVARIRMPREELTVRHELISMCIGEPTLGQKVEYLGRPDAYYPAVKDVLRRETHMSWVFLAGDRVYKLKKPVRFPYLDFSMLRLREAACRAELNLNRRLAPDVYLGVMPLVVTAHGLSLGGSGTTVDWLVVMRRLDESQTLERRIEEGHLEAWQLDRLAATLVKFYQRAIPASTPPARCLPDWHRNIAYNRRVLLDSRLGCPPGLVRRIDGVQRKFLTRRNALLAQRVRERRIIDGHGDLRPEHIWLGDPVKIIDCLEFNTRLRAVDPVDEIAFLSLECERLGASWAGEHVKRRVFCGLDDGRLEELFLFYRCHRAMLRARLAVAHLLEPNPRTPEKWPRLARAYLRIAAADAARLERLIKTRRGR
jgi:aminoglycoside phosphotransferase family enzyme